MYSFAITRVSVAPDEAAVVNCNGGWHAMAKVGPSEGKTVRRGHFAILNS